jgi:two-component system chemotaxis response regulator CheB
MSKIRLLIVDDSVVIRRLVSICLAEDPEIEIAGTASNGQICLAKIDQLAPDLVILDIEMPVLDGLQTVTAIRKTRPRLPVIMFSTLTERGATATIDALSRGASDYVPKPANGGSVGAAMDRLRQEMIPKIKALCRRVPAKPAELAPMPALAGRDRYAIRPRPASGLEVVAIGVSTGGPNALAALFSGLAKDFPAAIVIVQHMPPMFTRLLAERLQAVSTMRVREGTTGAVVQAGEAWVAPGGFHMEVERVEPAVQLRLHEGPPENSCRPAVDVLFRSVARAYGRSALSVILTGMGQDGFRGCESVREAGGQVLAQDEASSVVWGMPGKVVGAGLADKVLPLSGMAAEINWQVDAGARPRSANTVAREPQPALAKTS